ncbi:hypothetical protein [Clostridium sp.]|uniref:hypothetical protein n=1 Tax=Clostridium sp. TaxID=1506 RepID=UPI002846F12F|nr:hypothetical protein [Clostridium sp.]MDR3597084.1 hypothetical protein [Clostridium sp.]
MVDFKSLLKKHGNNLFNIHRNLQALKFNQEHYPIIRYDRGNIYSDYEFYWCSSDIPVAPLQLVWASHSNSPSLTLSGVSGAIPTAIQQKAVALLQELNSQRELVALYRCGNVKDDIFTLSSWLIPFPAGYKPDKEEGEGVYYTVKQDGTLGLAGSYANNKELYAALNL